MDLLGSYGDESEEEEQKDAAQGAAHGDADEASDAVNNLLPGFESYTPNLAAAGKPPIGAGSQGRSPSITAGRLRGGQGGHDSDGTPGAFRPRHHRFKVVSKSSTPVVHGSPSQNMPSDESTPNSPARRASMAAIADVPPPSVSLPDKPDGEVEQEVADRVAHYMHLRGKPQPVKVNRDLYDKKEFHNPGILEMLMASYGIAEKGTNYPKVRGTITPSATIAKNGINSIRSSQNGAPIFVPSCNLTRTASLCVLNFSAGTL